MVLVDHGLHRSPGIVTSGKVPTLEEAKARFRTSWERVKAHMAAKNIDHAEPDPSLL
jgi:hypothetical protein